MLAVKVTLVVTDGVFVVVVLAGCLVVSVFIGNVVVLPPLPPILASVGCHCRFVKPIAGVEVNSRQFPSRPATQQTVSDFLVHEDRRRSFGQVEQG